MHVTVVSDCQHLILQNISVFSKISKESTSFFHIHEKYSVSSTFLYNGNSKCYVVRILYAISFQWSKCFGYRRQQIILKLTITDSRCWQSGTTVKDISKVNDNGNQYKQKLILWYWTKNYFLKGFTASKIYFYFGTISMFWNFNFIPMVKMFWLSETADYFETDYHWQ
jgi:hypothetical protein